MLKKQLGNLSERLKDCGLYDRKSTETSNLAFLPPSHSAPHLLCFYKTDVNSVHQWSGIRALSSPTKQSSQVTGDAQTYTLRPLCAAGAAQPSHRVGRLRSREDNLRAKARSASRSVEERHLAPCGTARRPTHFVLNSRFLDLA